MLRVILVSLVANIACGTASTSGQAEHGAGPLVHASSQLKWLDAADGKLAFGRVGLRRLEVLSLPQEDGQPTVEAEIERVDCTSFPIALDTVDLDGDGTREIVISDSGCGNWIARSGSDGWTARPLDRELPAMAPAPTVIAIDDCGAHGACVAFASSYGVELAVNTADGWHSEAITALPPYADFMQVGSLAVFAKESSGATALIHQEAGRLIEYRLCPSCEDVVGARLEMRLRGGALSVGFDHFVAVLSESLFGIGVETFPATAGVLPRRAKRLLRDGKDLRVAPGPEVDVATWTSWRAGNVSGLSVLDLESGALHVGTVDSSEVTLEASTDARWSMHELPTPVGKRFNQPDVRGAELLARSTPDWIETIAYDGFQLMRVRFSADLSVGSSSTYTLHDARNDLAW